MHPGDIVVPEIVTECFETETGLGLTENVLENKRTFEKVLNPLNITELSWLSHCKAVAFIGA